MTTFNQAVTNAKKLCREHDVPEQTVMAYLYEIANVESYNLYMHFDDEMSEELLDTFNKGIERIINHEPLAHVLGYSWFYGYKFKVNEDVLIPRYETEELVANILAKKDEFFMGQDVDVIDIGTGSGAIAISLAKEESTIHITASDISEPALVVARENAAHNEAKVDFVLGDMLQPFIEKDMKVDILISNPPYIPQDEELEEEVVDHEPHVALFGGSDGLAYYRQIFKDCKKVLKPRSFMAFEIGYNQFEALEKEILSTFDDCRYEIVKDINGKNRMLFVYFGM